MGRENERARCRTCGRADLYRSRRRGPEVVLSWLGFFPFRCRACGERSFFGQRAVESLGPLASAPDSATR